MCAWTHLKFYLKRQIPFHKQNILEDTLIIYLGFHLFDIIIIIMKIIVISNNLIQFSERKEKIVGEHLMKKACRSLILPLIAFSITETCKCELGSSI